MSATAIIATLPALGAEEHLQREGIICSECASTELHVTDVSPRAANLTSVIGVCAEGHPFATYLLSS